MMKLFCFVIFLVLMGCKNSTKKQTSENFRLIDEIKVSIKQDTSLSHYNGQYSVKTDSQIKTFNTGNKIKNNRLREIPPPIRYIEFPCDNNFNGKPMIQQENISQNSFEKYPDTLVNLAIARYKTYDNFFPKAIADNFDEGISKEMVIYPSKLIFRFQVFENEFASNPYISKDVIIRRKPNGELYSE